jgi:hypothetical protein
MLISTELTTYARKTVITVIGNLVDISIYAQGGIMALLEQLIATKQSLYFFQS